MSSQQFKVILLRHAESKKNLHLVHGGTGEELTDFGIRQAQMYAKDTLEKLNVESFSIYSSTSLQTKETAKIIGKEWNIKVEVPITFRPLYLGIADGVTQEDVMRINPTAGELLNSWRNREIDIKELKIPLMESYISFWDRGISFLGSISHCSNSLIVCTTSLMILLCNIMLDNHPTLTDKYRHIPISNCDSIAFDTFDFQKFALDSSLTTVNISFLQDFISINQQ